MKKFWIVLLALGLVAGFAMSASAADVKFSGSYYVTGIYIDNPSLKKSESRTATDVPSQAFYQNRLRIQTEFKIAEGLMLVTRFDALEKAWGYGVAGYTPDAWRWGSAALGSQVDTVNRPSGGTQTFNTGGTAAREQENIEFERAYVDFTTKIGRFMVGYQDVLTWGTTFLNTSTTRPAIKYMVPIGPLTVVAMIEKAVDQNVGNGLTTTSDANIYDLGAVYKFGAGEAGILWQYGDNNAFKAIPVALGGGWTRQFHVFLPYAKMKFGPVYFEAEAFYGFGDWQKYEVASAATPNVTASAYGIYLHAKADIGPAYVGGQFVYMTGDDPDTLDKREGTMAAALLAGQAYDPCLILWNDGLYGAQHRVTAVTGYATGNSPSVFIDNAWMYQIYGGFKPVKEADIMLSVTYAYADKKPGIGAGKYVSDVYGTEVDLVAKYKLFDNLEYMIGAGYLFTGDYFKGASATNKIDNNYMLVHKLTLSF
jgi:hypothetical protein